MAAKSHGLDRRLLAHKVQWEGGVLGALQYGIRSAQISDPELAGAWAEIERLYATLLPKVAEIERQLAKAA